MEPIERLKHVTAPLHRAVESTAVARAIGSDDATERDVQRYLVCMGVCVTAAEAAVGAALGADALATAWDYRPQGPDLAADVAAFAQDVDQRPADPIVVQDETAALGVLYVLQGSRFGRHVIGQTLRRRGIELARRSRYLLHGGIDAAAWRRFGARLNAALHTPTRLASAEAGALHCFETFRARFAAEAESASARSDRATIPR